MQTTRFKIAAATTLAALGILAALALAAGGQEKTSTTASVPEEVRTEVVQETVHRTRRARASRRLAAPAARRLPGPVQSTVPQRRHPSGTTIGPRTAHAEDGSHGRGRGEDDHHDEFEDGHHSDDDHGHGRGRGRGRGRGGDHD